MIITDVQLLRNDCALVETIDEYNAIKLKLEEALAWCNRNKVQGAGLAAPQIGIYKKVAIVRVDANKVDLVNSKLEAGYNPVIFKGEGCLSFPGLFVDTRRFNEILVSNNIIYPQRFIATDFMAVVVQHELNHLESILLTDLEIKKG